MREELILVLYEENENRFSLKYKKRRINSYHCKIVFLVLFHVNNFHRRTMCNFICLTRLLPLFSWQ